MFEQWLKETFLGYLDDWEKSVKAREGFSAAQKTAMLLSAETRLGLRITGKLVCTLLKLVHVYTPPHSFPAVNSFIEMVEYLFTIPDVSLFLSNKICQDPLENFFGQQRQRGRVNENPSAKEFLKNTQALRVIQNTCKSVRGNCRGGTTDKENFSNTPLPKRKRSDSS